MQTDLTWCERLYLLQSHWKDRLSSRSSSVAFVREIGHSTDWLRQVLQLGPCLYTPVTNPAPIVNVNVNVLAVDGDL